MKKLLALLLAAVMALSLTTVLAEGDSAEEVPALEVEVTMAGVTQSIEAAGVTFMVPSDWTPVEVTGDLLAAGGVFAATTADQSFGVQAICTTSETETLDTFWDALSANEQVLALSETYINDWYYLLYSGESYSSAVCEPTEGVFVTFTFVGAGEAAAANQDTMMQVLASLAYAE